MPADEKLRRRYVYIGEADWAWLRAQSEKRKITISAILRDMIERRKKA